MIRHQTPKVGPSSFLQDWELWQESGPPSDKACSALGQREVAMKPRMSPVRGEGPALGVVALSSSSVSPPLGSG